MRFDNWFGYPDGSEGWFDLQVQAIQAGIIIQPTETSERKKFNRQHGFRVQLLGVASDAIFSLVIERRV